MFTHLDLFAGIGGFSRAVHWLGGTTVGFVEWDAWCRRTLYKHWSEAHFHGDIKTLTAATLRDWGIRTRGADISGNAYSVNGPKVGTICSQIVGSGGTGREVSRQVDLITGGYPCQPFSLAGQRLGAEDDRHLWPEMRRVIDLCRPRYVLAENVAGHVSMGLDTVLSDLEADGYTCGAVVIPACAVNALHRRDRVWILASQSTNPAINQSSPRWTTTEVAESFRNRTDNHRGCAKRDNGQAARTLDIGPDGISPGLVRRPATGPAEPDLIRAAWADGSWELDLPRVVAEEPERRQKLQAAGNAIVPIVAYEILRVMIGQEAAA
jgi:DNA (cytosine-5)-methyltransferase 1